MAVHLLIVDALNLIRRIHAVQGSPCVDTCLHALEQLIVHSQPTHAVAVFDDEDRAHGWRHQRLPGVQSRPRADAGDAGRRDAGRCGPPSNSGDPLLGLAGQRSRRSRRHPGGEGSPGGPSGHHRLHRQRLLPACCRPPSASATTFRSAGWTPPSSPASSASPRSSWRITGAGGDQQLEGAGRGGHWTQKRRPAAERVSGPGGAVRPPGRGPGEVA